MFLWHLPFFARMDSVSFSSLVKNLGCMCTSVMRHAEGEAKFWMEPQIALAQNVGLNTKTLRQAQTLIEEHEHDIRTAWRQHFGG